jgi:hypothetical protein
VGAEPLRQHAAALADATGIPATVIEEGMRVYVLLEKMDLPKGAFRVECSDILFIADQQYPLSAMDMFWTEVEVVRLDGAIPQGSDSVESYLGRSWRRFSWHRNGVWSPGGNPLLDHFALMEARLALEPKQ